MAVSLIIPAYNEERRIEKTLIKYYSYLSDKFRNFELIVITDGCKDRTPEIVSNFARKHPNVIHLNYPKKLGKGGAIIEGFKVANGNIIGFVDADGATPPDYLDEIFKVLEKNGIDGVIASRRVKGAKIIKKQPIIRRVLSLGFNILVRFLFLLPYSDTQCGCKFFRDYAVKKVLPELGLTDWAFDVDLLYRMKKHGFKVVEVPVTWMHVDDSKLDLKRTPIRMLLSVIGLRIKTSPFKFIAKLPVVKYIYEIIKE